jgi:hypothetical protein
MLFLGIDWGEHHHPDLCLLDQDGMMLAARRITDGLAGVGELHALVAAHAQGPAEVVVGIETDRGLLVGALLAAGYQMYAVNPHTVSPLPRPARQQPGQVRPRGRQGAGRPGRNRPAQPSPGRRRQSARRAGGPCGARTGTNPGAGPAAHQGSSAAGAGRRGPAAQPADPSGSRSRRAGGAAVGRTRANRGGLPRGGRRPWWPCCAASTSRSPRWSSSSPPGSPPPRTPRFCAASPGLGWCWAHGCWPSSATILTATRPPRAARRSRAPPRSPILRAAHSGGARAACNQRLVDACYLWAFAALTASPGACRCYDAHRARGASHHQALRALGNPLVGILHGCLAQRVATRSSWPGQPPSRSPDDRAGVPGCTPRRYWPLRSPRGPVVPTRRDAARSSAKEWPGSSAAGAGGRRRRHHPAGEFGRLPRSRLTETTTARQPGAVACHRAMVSESCVACVAYRC